MCGLTVIFAVFCALVQTFTTAVLAHPYIDHQDTAVVAHHIGGRSSSLSTLIGYMHNWDAGAPYPGRGFDGTAPYIRLKEFPVAYNVLIVAFVSSDASTGEVAFVPKAQSVDDFKSDVQAAKGQGRKILLSIGGADSGFVITQATGNAFATSLAKTIDDFDFDGIDIDLEGGSVASSDPVVLSNAMRTVRAHRVQQGKPCYFSMAPEFPHLRTGFYVTLAKELAAEWDFVMPQLYNQGGDGITVGDSYVSGTNEITVFIREIYKAFVTSGNSNFGVSFQPTVFCICTPATNWAAGSGYATPDQIATALTQLQAQGYSPTCLATWSANWDSTNGYAYAKTALSV